MLTKVRVYVAILLNYGYLITNVVKNSYILTIIAETVSQHSLEISIVRDTIEYFLNGALRVLKVLSKTTQ